MLGAAPAHRPHILWTVVQVQTGLTFSALFSKITHPRLAVDEELARSRLDKVFVGHTKESLSTVDEQLIVDDVCAMFGQHVKFTVTLPTLSEDAATVSEVPLLRNVVQVCNTSTIVVQRFNVMNAICGA